MQRLFKRFFRRDDGAMTIDWVVMGGTVIGLGLAVLSLVGDSTQTLATTLDTELTSIEVRPSGGQ